jgi:hypothetical protein
VVRTGTAARQAQKQRAAELAAAAGRLRSIEPRYAERLAGRAAAVEEAGRQHAALRALSPRIAAAVARHPDYERQRQAVLGLRAVAAAAHARARQADIDREQKGRSFRDDALFGYLLKRGYGTAAYRGRGMFAGLDRRVAALVQFEAARAQFAVLNELPPHLRNHAEEQAARASEAEEALDEFERSAIDAAGGDGIRAALADAQAQIAAADAALLGLQDERDAMLAAGTRLTGDAERASEQALLALAQALGGQDRAGLAAVLQAAPRDGDDALLAQLDDAQLRIAEDQADVADQQARLATLAVRRRGLEDIAFELKTHHFDDPRSQFRDDELIAGRLDAFLTGEIGAAAYWALWRRAQGWSAGTSDWGGGVGLPRHGREAAEPAAPQPAAQFSRPQRPSGTAAA